MSLPISTPAGHTGLHVRYEKAGLIFDALPVPWNADAVIVEANVRLPKGAPHAKQDFTLRWSAEEPGVTAELLMDQTPQAPMRVFFRVPRRQETGTASVHWREHLLGVAEVPIVGMKEIIDGFSIEMPTVHVALADRTVACQAFVSAQAKGVCASSLVRSPTLLAPVYDLALRVHVKRPSGAQVGCVQVALTPEQMAKRQTLVTVQLPKLRRIGTYEVSWWLASRCLHTQKIRAVSKKTLLRSLRISTSRFVLTMDDGTYRTVRSLPIRDGQLCLDGFTRIDPSFYVCSGEHGMAGLVPITLRALVGDVVTTVGMAENVLVTDGPRSVGTFARPASELAQVKHYTLACGDTILGNLPLTAAPKADFTAEGGFAPLDDFLWSPAADEQLKDRLGKLLGEE